MHILERQITTTIKPTKTQRLMNVEHKILRGGESPYESPIIESVMITGEAGFYASSYETDDMTEENGTW